MSEDKKPTIPGAAMQEPKSSRNMSRSDLQKENTELRKIAEQADERAAGQAMREQELEEREAELAARERQIAELEALATTTGIDEQPEPTVSIDDKHAQQFKREDSRIEKDPLESGKKMPDITPYLEQFPENQFMWINDVDGDVQRWINLGAEPVEWINQNSKTFEGLTDQHDTKWVSIVAGESRAGPFRAFLLMIDRAEYDRIKIQPVKNRQELIKRSMAHGIDQSGTGHAEEGFRTYAPNLPSGKQGLERLREVAGEIPGI